MGKKKHSRDEDNKGEREHGRRQGEMSGRNSRTRKDELERRRGRRDNAGDDDNRDVTRLYWSKGFPSLHRKLDRHNLVA